VPQSVNRQGPVYLVLGKVPAARMHDVQQRLPSLTRGEGVVEFAFDCYEEVNRTIPIRPRSDYNPLNRTEYLLHVVRRV
jgi:ribosomal protection tetracycline resistance protein